MLGRLEQIPLREIWISESQGFTPWLAEDANLALLSETLDMDLALEKVECQVGSFRADMLCRVRSSNEGVDHQVLIENQLERTDHIHLGQLLTYAAGLQTFTIVWIAAEFSEQHRAALDWLNEITNERCRFFGLEVELWRIAEGPVAPKFNIVSKPNEWSKSFSRRGGATRVRKGSNLPQIRANLLDQIDEVLGTLSRNPAGKALADLQTARVAEDSFWESGSPMIEWLQECCDRTNPDARTGSTDLFRSYTEWLEARKLDPDVVGEANLTWFGRSLNKINVRRVKNTQGRIERKGIRLLANVGSSAQSST